MLLRHSMRLAVQYEMSQVPSIQSQINDVQCLQSEAMRVLLIPVAAFPRCPILLG